MSSSALRKVVPMGLPLVFIDTYTVFDDFQMSPYEIDRDGSCCHSVLSK